MILLYKVDNHSNYNTNIVKVEESTPKTRESASATTNIIYILCCTYTIPLLLLLYTANTIPRNC